MRAEGVGGFGGDERVAALRDHHRVEDDGDGAIAGGEEVGDGGDEVRGVEHADFDGVGADVVEARADLPQDHRDGDGVDASDADGVFVDDGRDGGHGVDAAGGGGFDVGLDAGATGTVGTGDGEEAMIVHGVC